MLTFGDKLQAARESKGYTQQVLADMLDVRRNAVTNWENDTNEPGSLKLLREIGRLLGVSVDYLIGDDALSLESAPITTKITTRPPSWEARRNIVLNIEVRVTGHEENE